MTPGTILIDDVNVYTWHDGHFDEALKMVIELPFYMFKSSKDYSEYTDSLRKLDHSLDEEAREKLEVYGSKPWFYSVVFDKRLYSRREEIASFWKNILQLNICNVSLANWICWRHFNRWTVVSKEQIPYKREPDFTIKTHSSGDGYTIAFNLDEDYYKEEMIPEIIQEIENLNKQLVETKITYVKNENEFVICVPFGDIIVDLLWKENLRLTEK